MTGFRSAFIEKKVIEATTTGCIYKMNEYMGRPSVRQKSPDMSDRT